MDVAATIAGPAPIQRATRLSFEDGSSSAKDVTGVTKTDSARADAGAATTSDPDREPQRVQGGDEEQLVQRLTAEDFAAIQEQLGLRPTPLEPDEPAIELPDPPRDFSSVVADAVVTIDEYLDWVNEAGGQLR